MQPAFRHSVLSGNHLSSNPSPPSDCLVDVKERLQLDNQLPLFVGYILAVELLQTVNTGSRDRTVQSISLLKLSPICRLTATHLDFHRNRWLAFLANGDLLVLSLD